MYVHPQNSLLVVLYFEKSDPKTLNSHQHIFEVYEQFNHFLPQKPHTENLHS